MANPETEFYQTPERAVGKAKVRLVPECYILPRRSIPKTIALYSFLAMAGVGAGMLVEVWIKEQVRSECYYFPIFNLVVKCLIPASFSLFQLRLTILMLASRLATCSV